MMIVHRFQQSHLGNKTEADNHELIGTMKYHVLSANSKLHNSKYKNN